VSVLGLKLIGGPNKDQLTAIRQLATQSQLPGFLYGVWDPIDFHVESYFTDCSMEALSASKVVAALSA
jgi:hypothetical protein